MQVFKVNKNIEIVCESQKTRNGFRHLATLIYHGREIQTVKCCYLNRTWERYEFQSVLEKLADESSLLDREKKLFLTKIENQFVKDDPTLKNLKLIANIASLGDIFGKTQEQRNDWKEKMLKAGLENKGLIMPDDWNELDENTKQSRLDGAIAQLS